jgi:hypothetical protein
MIVTSFEQPGGYFNQFGIAPYPIPTSFGSLLTGAGWFWAPNPAFPPNPSEDVPDFAYGDPVAYYQTIVTDDLLTWVSAQPESGLVPAGTSLDLAVTFDATGLNDGNYDGRLIIHSNDPDEPAVPVATHLHVTGAADIALAPDSLDYGSPFVGAVLVDTVEVKNIGTATLVVTGMTPAPAAYTAGFSGAFALEPGEQRKVSVPLAPAAPVGPVGHAHRRQQRSRPAGRRGHARRNRAGRAGDRRDARLAVGDLLTGQQARAR